jgi:hypothetical protein
MEISRAHGDFCAGARHFVSLQGWIAAIFAHMQPVCPASAAIWVDQPGHWRLFAWNRGIHGLAETAERRLESAERFWP